MLDDRGLQEGRLSRGDRIGEYEILGRLGAGGMGEVYRARDARLGREVALKVLPEAFASDPERARRFAQEARAASALRHPNIVTVYETGTSGGRPYLAMELVEGRTLREISATGPLTIRKLLDLAAQVASGLARAHEEGIVHRDLKPENVMISKDGFAKILDFGIAKFLAYEGNAPPGEATMLATDAGVLLGTTSYMSPEQASGLAVDFRSDQFSFGSMLYELATGRRAFDRATKPQTMAAIIGEEPEPVSALLPTAPTPLVWIIERCLAKAPAERYAATRDLASDLAKLRDHPSELSGVSRADRARPRRSRFAAATTGLILAAGLVGAYWLGKRLERGQASSPRFRQITFSNAGISTARFAPDGQTVVYAAQWEGKPPEIFAARLDSPETRSLGLSRAEILSVSASGQLALLLQPPFSMVLRPPHSDTVVRDPSLLFGTLAEMPLAGGAPRELVENVFYADWAPDGKNLAVVRFVDGKNRLEFPVGNLLFQSPYWLNFPRVSPSGDRVVFADVGGMLQLSGPGGGAQPLGQQGWEPAWNRSTNEVWSTWRAEGSTRLSAVSPDGRTRQVAELPGDFALYDIDSGGRLLLGRVFETSEIFADFPGESRPRILSHLDRSTVEDLSADGETVVLQQVGQQGGVYLRQTVEGSSTKRLSRDVNAGPLSPDGKWVLGVSSEGNPVLLPTGAGQPRPVDAHGLEWGRAGFFPDGRRLFFIGTDPGSQSRRVWVTDLDGGRPRPISPEGERVRRGRLSGDGRFVCARPGDGSWTLYPTEGGESRPVAGLLPGEEPIQWTADGKLLFVRSADELRPGEQRIVTRVFRLDPWSGRRELWKEIQPVDSSTGGAIGSILFSADGRICVYTHHRYSSDLFLAEGLK